MPPPGPWQSLRALRILRVLRLVSSVPTLRHVVEGLLLALPGLASIVVLLMLLPYIAAVMATHLYRDISPEHFDDIGNSLFTLFKIITLEGWPDIATVMDAQPLAWIFFTGYILVATFMVLNLLIGVVVSAIQSRIADELAAETAGARPARRPRRVGASARRISLHVGVVADRRNMSNHRISIVYVTRHAFCICFPVIPFQLRKAHLNNLRWKEQPCFATQFSRSRSLRSRRSCPWVPWHLQMPR